jgi:aspartate carbamoyltransferase
MNSSFEAFREAVADERRRRSVLWREGRPWHVLSSLQFERGDLTHLFQTADRLRTIEAEPNGATRLLGLLAGRRVVNLFGQPSTRTCESFVAAEEKLGASARVLSDLKATSFSKGESVEDGVRTLACFYDLIVARHPDDDFALRASWALDRSERPVPVISAGSGRSEHPTQALLDIYTLHHRWRGEVDGRRIHLVGDIGRNRAARSFAHLLTRFSGISLDITCHPDWAPEPAFVATLRAGGVEVAFHDRLEPALDRGPDAIYLTRLQQEWDQAPAELGTDERYVLREELRERIPSTCLILHPLPRVNELPESWEDHPGLAIWHQVRNGVWVRAALLTWIFGLTA